MRFLSVATVTFTLLLGSFVFADATIKYVAPNGTGNGLESHPGNPNDITSWASGNVDENLRVIFLSGNYVKALELENISRAQKTITLEAAQPEGTVFLSTQEQTGVYAGTIALKRCQGFILRHFHFRMDSGSEKFTNHLRISQCSDIVVDECTFSGLKVHTGSITISNQSKRVTVSRCLLEDMWGRGPNNSSNHMIYIADRSNRIRVLDCTFKDNFGGGWIKLKQAAKDVFFSNCRFTNSGRSFLDYQSPAVNGAIQVNNNEGRENVCKGIVVVNNVFENRSNKPMNAVWVRRQQRVVPQGHFQLNTASGKFVAGTVNFEPLNDGE